MNQRIICKALGVAVILLFLGLAIQPSVAVQPETEIEIEPKDYLFQTIIDIANNPDVKELLEQYDNDLFSVDIDRSVYRKLLLRNPRLMFNMLFTKPSLSVEYLNKCYNNGIEITNVLGEDIALEIIENVEVIDTKLFDELNNIISKDEELLDRLETLKEFNKDLNPVEPFEDNQIICTIAGTLFVLCILSGIIFFPFAIIEFINKPILEAILFLVLLPIYLPVYIIHTITVLPIALISFYLILEFDCIKFYT